MFEMTVNDVLSVHNKHTVFGECTNSHELKGGIIKDEYGNEYKYAIPFIKMLEYDDSKITLQLIGDDIDLNALMGRKLIQQH